MKRYVSIICFIQLIMLCTCCLLCTLLNISDAIPELISILVIAIGSLLIFVWLYKIYPYFQSVIIFSGYILRIVCLLLDLYGRNYFTILHSGADSEGFFSMAVRYYNGDYSESYTWYPFILRGIFAVFGQNRIVAQYVNIIFWLLTVLLILKICYQFYVPVHHRLIACGLLAFLPNNIFLSSILLRESIMIFFDLLGMYFFIRWMKKGKFNCLLLAFLAPIPAIVLHTASISIWVTFAFIISVWDRQEHIFRITTKTGIVLIGFTIFLSTLYFTDLKTIFMTYFNQGFSIYAITHRVYDIGGSNYLTNMDYQHWYELVPFTLIRMFYFVCSPILTECRGLQDYLCFLGDVVPTVLVIFSIMINMRKKEVSRYSFVGILSYIMTVGIFAWGTANAGTAMRHRGLLWGILIASYCISFGKTDVE